MGRQAASGLRSATGLLESCLIEARARRPCKNLICAQTWTTPMPCYARSMYLPVRVSTLIFSPVLINSGA